MHNYILHINVHLDKILVDFKCDIAFYNHPETIYHGINYFNLFHV